MSGAPPALKKKMRFSLFESPPARVGKNEDPLPREKAAENTAFGR